MTHRPPVVMAITDLGNGAGSERATEGWSAGLAAAGWDVTIVTRSRPTYDLDVRIVVGDPDDLPEQLVDGAIVVRHWHLGAPRPPNCLAQVAFFHCVPLLDDALDRDSVPLAELSAQLAGYDDVAAHSQAVADLLEERCGLRGVHVVNPFADPAFAAAGAEADGAERPRDRVLAPHRLVPMKGLEVLLAALDEPALASRGVHADFVDFGAQPEARARLTAAIDAHPRARLLPATTSPAASAARFAGYRVVVQPSRAGTEAFGMVSVEAQHAGCTVVASDTAGLPDTDCGRLRLVPPEDPAALAAGIAAALDGEPGSLVLRHTLEHSTRAFEGWLESVIDRRGR